jgi:hypothetical protein
MHPALSANATSYWGISRQQVGAIFGDQQEVSVKDIVFNVIYNSGSAIVRNIARISLTARNWLTLAAEWVERPNTVGISQFADGGLMAGKPYIAIGKYIDRMSNHCKGCCYNPAHSTGESACPFTTLYWHYLIRHADTLAKNPRMLMQLKNAICLTAVEREVISGQAAALRQTARGRRCSIKQCLNLGA